MQTVIEAQPTLETLKEKFLELLEMDRESPEFESLFQEVDAGLDRVAGLDADADVA